MEAQHLTTEEVAKRFRVSHTRVRNWRYADKGPRWFKVGKRVLYRADDVQAWEDAAVAGAAA